MIFSFSDFYHNNIAKLKQLCKSTNNLCLTSDIQMKYFMALYSGDTLEFDLAPERNTVSVVRSSYQKHRNLYFKNLILRNWRWPNNDLDLVLDSQILS